MEDDDWGNIEIEQYSGQYAGPSVEVADSGRYVNQHIPTQLHLYDQLEKEIKQENVKVDASTNTETNMKNEQESC